MNILDVLIIIFIFLGAFAGLRRGLIKQTVLLVGLVLTLVISFYLRVPIATFFYKNLPFFNFTGIFKGMSVLNILVYELIAFLIVFSVLYLALRIILKITGIIEKILKMTIILGFFSKIGGAIVGIIESYVVIFILLFIFHQPFINISGMEESKLADPILNSTPIMSDVIEDTRLAINEIYELAKNYEDEDAKKFNEDAIKLFLKYNIVTQENINLLKEKGKI
ncbi:MAG: CvpA family protein [bacterium]|nr:CvpA family protein [bacterium]